MSLLFLLLTACLPDPGDFDDTGVVDTDTGADDTSDSDTDTSDSDTDTSDTDSDTSDTDTSDTDTSDTDTDTSDTDTSDTDTSDTDTSDTDTSDTDTDTDTDTDSDSDTDPVIPSCPSTHAKVGWTADIYGHSWGIDGVATIVNDCTILIEDFDYQGGGKYVDIVAAKNGVWGQGYILESGIHGTVYSGATLVYELNSSQSLDNIDNIGVFDSDLSIIFGEGTFAP